MEKYHFKENNSIILNTLFIVLKFKKKKMVFRRIDSTLNAKFSTTWYLRLVAIEHSFSG